MPIAAPSTVTAVPTKRELMFTQAAEQKASQVGLGRAITWLRERAGLSQAELAKRSNLSGPTLGEIERGDVEARWGSLRGVAKGLEVGLDSLLRLGIELAPGNAGDRLRQTEREARDLDVERVAREGDGQEG
jgi:transcriptional regulator with XRE-family HTH domain